MNGNLLLSKTGATCTSTAPNYDYDTVTVSLPAEMSGATFESAAFTYSQSQTSGTATIKFYDTREDVSNARILKRLQDGAREFTLLFSFKSASGTRTKTWTGLNIAIGYKPAARLSGTQTAADGSTVFWAIDAASLARGESVPVLLTVTAVNNCDALHLQMRAGSQAESFGAMLNISLPAGRSVTTSATLNFDAAYTMSSRVMAAALKFTLYGADLTDTDTPWETIGLNLVRVRNAPVVNLSVSDVGGAYAQVGAFVQGKSVLRLTASITLDTEADEDNAIKARALTFGGKTVDMPGDRVDIDTAEFSGTIARSLSVTDTYGRTGTASGSTVIKPYAPPSISALNLERYATVYPSGGGVEYPADDGSPHIRIAKAAYFVQYVNGRNAYTLGASWDGGSALIEENSDGGGDMETIEHGVGAAFAGKSFSPDREYIITFTLTDALGGSATAAFILPKAGGIFSIEAGGVAIGRRANTDADNPRFDVAYPAFFEAGIFDGDGNPLGGVNYVIPETRVGTYLGKPLYRKGAEVSAYSATSADTTSVDFGITPTRIVSISGFVKTNSYGDLPLNCYHSSSIRAFCRPDGLTGRVLGYCGSANSGAVIFIEYTKD